MAAKTILRIEGMTCQHCGERVESALRAVPGVLDVQIDWKSGRGLIEHEDPVATDSFGRAVALSADGTAHRYKAQPVLGDDPFKDRGPRSPLFFLVLLLPALCCGGGALLLPVLAGFLVSKWIGIVPGLALAAVLGLGTWWLLRRRRKLCATCLEAGTERANP